MRADGSIPASAAEQAELALLSLVELLRLEGLTMADLVETVSYHVDLEKILRLRPTAMLAPWPQGSLPPQCCWP